MPDAVLLVVVASVYLSLLAATAWAVDRSPSLRARARHPLVFALALGVYNTAHTFFGSPGFASRAGLTFLATYLGATIAALLAPTVGARLLRLTRRHQLASIADLFAFRYQSRAAGTLVTIAALIASLPYIAQQIRAVVDAVRFFGVAPASSTILALSFSIVVAIFTVVFGAQRASSRRAQDGLLAAVAVESLVKLTALLAVGVVAVAALGGLRGVQAWLAAHPAVEPSFHAPVRNGGAWPSFLILGFAASILQPRQFHVAFAEGTTTRDLREAAWAFPLFLLLMGLPLLPIAWAGAHTLPGLNPDLYVLGIAQKGGRAVAALAFVGGVSAASAMVIVTTLALSGMALNHLALSAPRVAARKDLYSWLLWSRRALIVAVVLAGYGAYEIMRGPRALVEQGHLSNVAVAQFLPGIIGVVGWRRATRQGFIAGLIGGFIVWGATALAPLLAPGFGGTSDDRWTVATVGSLGVNALLFAFVSLRAQPSADESAAADACIREVPLRLASAPATEETFADLRRAIGRFVDDAAAEKQIAQAREELGESPSTGELATCVERNLTEMVGPLLARMIVDEFMQRAAPAAMAIADQIRFLDERLKREGVRLDGLAAELDHARRYLSALLDGLPLGACAVDARGSVVLWNHALAQMTGLEEADARVRQVASLPQPWGEVLERYAASPETPSDDVGIRTSDGVRTLRVHASRLEREGIPGGVMLLLEDVSERRGLEAKLVHQDRLASIGRLVAAVAEQIGNPLHAIAFLAQNMRDDGDATLVRKRLDQILEQVRRIDALVHDLGDFIGGSPSPRGEASRTRPLRVSDPAEDAARFVRLDRRSRGVAFDVSFGAEHVVLGDRRKLVQVLVILLLNACQASEPGQRVDIESARDGDRVVIRVRDRGRGISAEIRARLFEPFVTTKPAGDGIGLGLWVAHGIVSEHHGTIEIDSEEGKGTTVSVWLPAAPHQGADA